MIAFRIFAPMTLKPVEIFFAHDHWYDVADSLPVEIVGTVDINGASWTVVASARTKSPDDEPQKV